MIELSDIDETVLITYSNETVLYTDDLRRRLTRRLEKWRLTEAVLSGFSEEKFVSDRMLSNVASVLPRETGLLYLVPNADKFFVRAYGEKIIEIVSAFLKELGVKRIKYGKHAIPRVERNLAFLAYFGFDAD